MKSYLPVESYVFMVSRFSPTKDDKDDDIYVPLEKFITIKNQLDKAIELLREFPPVYADQNIQVYQWFNKARAFISRMEDDQ